MANFLAIFNSRAAFAQDKEMPTLKWRGFSQTVNPKMVQNNDDGIVFRLEFATPEPDTKYAVLVIVENMETGQIKFGRVVRRHTDWVEITGGHVNGLKKNLVFMVQVIT